MAEGTFGRRQVTFAATGSRTRSLKDVERRLRTGSGAGGLSRTFHDAHGHPAPVSARKPNGKIGDDGPHGPPSPQRDSLRSTPMRAAVAAG